MRRFAIAVGALVGLLTGIVVIVVSYLGGQIAELPFFPFDMFEAVTRVLPGAVITVGIDTLVKLLMALQVGPLSQTAKLAEQMLALAQFLLIAVAYGAVVAAIAKRVPRDRLTIITLILAAVLFVVTALVVGAMGFPAAGAFFSVLWLALVYGVWGMALGWLLREMLYLPGTDTTAVATVHRDRRSVLYLTGTAVVALVTGAIGLADALGRGTATPEPEAAPVPTGGGETTGAQAAATPAVMPTTSGVAASPPEPTLEARIEPAPGTRPEITDNKDFYRIDINLLPPKVDASTWKLEISGLVENPMSLTLDQIRARPAVSQYVTLSCISNPLGGELIGASLWTGTRLKDLLQEVGLKPGAKELYIEAVDGFYESVYQEDMMDERTLLVYEMNGEPLSPEHGFPLRIYIPNRYGMKQPKWITSMEVLDRVGPGYWVDRGWSAQAIAQTTSVVDGATTKNMDPATKVIPIGGIAWAGARGISKVEVQVDDTPWVTAQLRTPPLSPLTWVQWRYDWPSQTGQHVLRVRAYDGTKVLQTTEPHAEHPNGATGIFSQVFEV